MRRSRYGAFLYFISQTAARDWTEAACGAVRPILNAFVATRARARHSARSIFVSKDVLRAPGRGGFCARVAQLSPLLNVYPGRYIHTHTQDRARTTGARRGREAEEAHTHAANAARHTQAQAAHTRRRKGMVVGPQETRRQRAEKGDPFPRCATRSGMQSGEHVIRCPPRTTPYM